MGSQHVKLHVDYLAAALLAAYLFWDGSGTAPWILLGAAVHELGHLSAIMLCGQKLRSFELRPFALKIRKDRKSPVRECLISAAGPVAGALLALMLTVLHKPVGAAASLVLTVFNLLPFYPLDGWRILDIILTNTVPQRTAKQIKTAAALTALATVAGILLVQLRGGR